MLRRSTRACEPPAPPSKAAATEPSVSAWKWEVSPWPPFQTARGLPYGFCFSVAADVPLLACWAGRRAAVQLGAALRHTEL